jgi:hypothetical protein
VLKLRLNQAFFTKLSHTKTIFLFFLPKQYAKKQPEIWLLPLFIYYFSVGPQQKSGDLTAHKNYHLPLLPSGPDGVHEFSLRETQLLLWPHSKINKWLKY